MNILVVDDVDMNRNILKAMLEAKGHVVYEAEDGEFALKSLELNPTDAIISDILMPNMNGFQLCTAVKKSEKYQQIPVIIYSSTHREEEEKRLAISCGANAFLEKPSPVKDLLNAIEIARNSNGIDERTDFAGIEEVSSQMGVLKSYSEVLVRTLEQKNQELLESEKRYLALIANVPAVIWSTDADGNTIYISPQVEKILGYTQEEIYQRGVGLWIGIIHPDDVKDVMSAYRKLFTNGKAFDQEFRVRRKDGEWVWIHDRASTTRFYDGKLYADGLYTDITQRKLEKP